MKQKILQILTTCLLLSSPLAAQEAEHLEWFPVGAEWNVYRLSNSHSNEARVVSVEKDTLLGGLACKQTSLNQYFHQQGDSLYQVSPKEDHQKILLYDMSKQTGDTIPLVDFDPFYFQDYLGIWVFDRRVIDTSGVITVDGMQLRYQIAKDYVVIEKLGSFYGSFDLTNSENTFQNLLMRGISTFGKARLFIYNYRFLCYQDSLLSISPFKNGERDSCSGEWVTVSREVADEKDNLTVIVNGSTTFRLHADRNIRLSDIRIYRYDGRAVNVNGRIDGQTVRLELPAGFYVMGFNNMYVKKLIP